LGSAVNPQKKLNASATRENNGLNILSDQALFVSMRQGDFKRKMGQLYRMSTSDAEHIIEAVSAAF